MRRSVAFDLSDPATSTLINRRAVRVPSPAGPRILATFSWVGPPRGLVILLSCRGEYLNADAPGYADSVLLRDVNGDGVPEIIVQHGAGTGTGWRQDASTIYRITRDTLAVVWSAVTFEGSYQGPQLGGQWERRGTISYPRAGQIQLTVDSGAVRFDSTKTWVFIGSPTRTTQIYAWSPATGSFKRSSH